MQGRRLRPSTVLQWSTSQCVRGELARNGNPGSDLLVERATLPHFGGTDARRVREGARCGNQSIPAVTSDQTNYLEIMAPNNATESGVSNMLGPTSARCVRRIARRAAAWWWKASVRCSTTQRLYAASDRLPENAAVRTSGVRRRSRGTSRGRKASRRIAANTYPTGLPTSHFGLVFCHFSLPSTKRANRSRPVRQPGVWARSGSPMPYTQNAGLACIGTVTVPAAALPVLACITITTYYFYYYYYVPRPCSTCSRWLHLRLASRVVWGRARGSQT